jgi:hypothetical protein
MRALPYNVVALLTAATVEANAGFGDAATTLAGGAYYNEPHWQEQLLSKVQPQPYPMQFQQFPLNSLVQSTQQQSLAPSDQSERQRALLSQLSSQIESALGQADKAAKREVIHEKTDEAVTAEMAKLAASMEKVAELQRQAAERQEQLQQQIHTVEEAQRNLAANQDQMHQQAMGQQQAAQNAAQNAQIQLQEEHAALSAAVLQKQQAQAIAANQAQMAASMQAQAQAAHQTAEQAARRASTFSSTLAQTANLMQNVASLSGPSAAYPSYGTVMPPAAAFSQPQVQQAPQLVFSQQQVQPMPQLAQIDPRFIAAPASPAMAQPLASGAWDLRGSVPPPLMWQQQQQQLQPMEMPQQQSQGSYGFMNWLGIR